MKNLLLLVLFLGTFKAFALPAPDFTATDSDGHTHHLYADYVNQGKLLVIEFFFTTCPPCNTHAPYVKTLYQNMQQQYPGQLEFMLVTTLFTDNSPQVAAYKTAKNLTMPGVGYDGNSNGIVSQYQSGTYGPFYGTPTFMIISPTTGEVFFDIRGNTPQETMDLLSSKIAQLLAPPPVPCHFINRNGQFIDEVKLTVDAANWDSSFTTGAYTLTQIPALQNGQAYTIHPEKTDNALNGVTTYDIVLIAKHILALQAFTSDEQFVAADVNSSGSVTTYDIVEIRKLILGIYNEFPLCDSWVFDPDTALAYNGECVSFMGIKKGDVDGSAIANSALQVEDRSMPVIFEIDSRALNVGERSTLHLKTADPSEALGFQMGLVFDTGKLEVLAVRSALPGFGPDNYHIQADRLAISYDHAAGLYLPSGSEILEMDVRARQSVIPFAAIQFAASPIAAFYPANETPQSIALRASLGDERMQASIFPNPASGRCAVQIDSEKSGRELLRLIDTNGRCVWSEMTELQAGANTLEIRAQALPAGLYFLQMGTKGLGTVAWE